MDCFRVARGGGWNDFGKNLRSAYRAAMPQNNSAYNVGLRLVCNADDSVKGTVTTREAAKPVCVDGIDIPEGLMGMDIGEKTALLYAETIKSAGTVIWNGPMGVFEFPQFAKGTLAVAKAVADSGAVSIVGGGDSVSAVTKLGFAYATALAQTGAKIVFNDRKQELVERGIEAYKAEGIDAYGGVCDVTKEDEVQ